MDPARISHETFLGKLLRLPFKLLSQGAVVRILRGPARGKRWIVGSSAHSFWLGFWELENQRLFASCLRPGDVVYDVGAHVGLYTLISSARVGDRGHVYAFEPSPRNARYLRRHLELNRVTNCTVIEAAVSDRPGWRRFDLTSHDTAGHISDTGTLNVRTAVLDEFVSAECAGRGPNALKIDAEGAEMEVLTGARRTIAKFWPFIFLSTHSEDADRRCCAFLQSAGYSLRRLDVDEIWAEKSR